MYNKDTGLEFVLTPERFATLMDLLDTAGEVIPGTEGPWEGYLQRVRRGLELSMVKKFSDVNEEYLSIKLYPLQMKALIEMMLMFGIYKSKDWHKPEELKEYIDMLKEKYPHRIWKYKEEQD